MPAFRGIDAGRHKLPVEFQLPLDIYTSIEVGEELVSVRYQIEVVSGSASKMIQYMQIQCFHGLYPKNFVQVIHVIAPRDLNDEFEMLSKPARAAKTIDKQWEFKKMEEIKFQFFFSGKLRASLALPKIGYTPGEPLNALIRIDNTWVIWQCMTILGDCISLNFRSAHSVKYASVYIVKQIMAISDKPVRDIKRREDETYGSFDSNICIWSCESFRTKMLVVYLRLLCEKDPSRDPSCGSGLSKQLDNREIKM